ncbi:hypothetical protein ACA910_010637 [Epithemia clementina (nom. ined.)]
MSSADREVQAGPSHKHGRPRAALLMKLIFFLLGVGILIPWNAYISAKAYFESRLCRSSSATKNNNEQSKNLANNLESTFAIAYNCSSVFTLGLLIFFQWIGDSRQKKATLLAQQSTMSTGEGSIVSQDSSRSSSSSSSDGNGHSFFLVVVPLTIFFVVFFLQAASVWLVDLDQMFFYYWTVGSLALCGLCGALASSGIVATAGLFMPDLAMGPFLSGQSAGGLGVALANLAAASFGDPTSFWNSKCPDDGGDEYDKDNIDPNSSFLAVESSNNANHCSPYSQIDHAVLCYFLLGSLVLAACLVGYCYVERIQNGQLRNDYETVQDHDNMINPLQDPSAVVSEGLNRSPAGLEMNNTLVQKRKPDQCYSDDEIQRELASHDPLNHLDLHSTTRSLDQATAPTTNLLLRPDAPLDCPDETKNETTEVFRLVRSPAISIFLIFFVTLALFPGWLSRLRSIRQCSNMQNRWDNDLYTPIAFVVFNAGDLIGRILSAYLPYAKLLHKPVHLVLASLARLAFFPLFFLCPSQHDNGGWAVQSDLYSWAVQLLFGVSNGCIVSAAFVLAPSLLPEVKHVQERSAEILTFALSFGLLSGSVFSVPVTSFFSR